MIRNRTSVSAADTSSQKKKRKRKPTPHRSRLWRKRWLIVVIPVTVFAGLIALAPGTPEKKQTSPEFEPVETSNALAGPFAYQPDDEVYALDFDPRDVRLGLLEGWDREQDAFEDTAALAYVSGPMYERHIDEFGQEITVPLGDLKLGSRVWRGRNRTASRQRAFIGILKDGSVDFGYGELTPARAKTYDMFVGGLHSIYNDLEEPPESYKGAYSISMGQRIRYYLPRIRMVYGLKSDGRIEMLMSKDGLTLEQTKDLARRRGLVAAYMPDHASKSRLIIPGVKGFTEEDANWISGGATSFVHVPYLLRLSERRVPLKGGLMADLTRRIESSKSCEGPSDCAFFYGGQLMDRALAGLNRVMEQGVEPIARMIWAPKPSPRLDHNQTTPVTETLPTRQPLREPPITADPLVLRERPDVEAEQDESFQSDAETQPWDFDLPPDLPPPVLLQEDQILPEDPEAWPQPIPPAPALKEPEPVSSADEQESIIYGAPPPPVLPPPPLP
ncbi:hypothetical protein [Synechococcus sp. UW179B]|uniref:hypothetical protein n=1 Tax=Synechococcus sp. UW179B TaxID=2575516 RepID=UPI000E0FF640|nr:hypothetical protein [Synechococcus sp. UW179B]